jgi:hypothetical protein
MALSLQRIIMLVTVALVMAAMLVVGSALPAAATHVGHANANACQGLVISLLATSNNPEGPFPPPKAAEELNTDVAGYTEGVREGEFFVVFPEGESFGCDPEEE